MEVKARRRFVQIDPACYGHPLDVAALRTLRTFKGLDYLCKKVLEYGAERIMWIVNIGNRVQVGPGQLPELFGMMKTACTILDLPPIQLFVEMNPIPNAFTSGVSRPFVVVTTGMLDLMEPDELQAVLAHEVGHVLSRHVLYRIIAENMSAITTLIGQATLGIGKLLGQGLELALLEWYRKSEFTADRASLLVVQDPDVIVSVMMKLAGGSSRYTRHMNQSAFLKQSEQYDALDESNLNKAYKLLQQVNLTHPIPVLRAKEIKVWGEAPTFRSIVSGDFDHRPACRPTCGYCSAEVPDEVHFCPHCGAPVSDADASRRRSATGAAHCPGCFSVVPPDFDDCPVCGRAL